MAWPSSLDIALKEWASVVRALESGRQILLLRKGGILEQGPKRQFEMNHAQFLLFPTYLHQSRGELKPEAEFQAATAEPNEVRITAAAVVSDIIQVESREQIDRLDDEHIWTPSLIDMRFSYKPEKPLYLVLLRAYRLHEPVTLVNSPAYAGCKSWVPLEHSIPTGDALSVLDDVKFEHRRSVLVKKLQGKMGG
jgi:hypothetical protein